MLDFRTNCGIRANVLAGLSYLFDVVAVIALFLERNNRWVRVHCLAAIAVRLVFWISGIVSMVPLFGWWIGPLFVLAASVLWVACMVCAFSGAQVPWIGKWMEAAENIIFQYYD